MTKQEILNAGWVFGNTDGFVGERIYPSWRDALESKRLVMRDIRVLNGEFFVHNPWKNTVEHSFGPDLSSVERYIVENGQVVVDGPNVWD